MFALLFPILSLLISPQTSIVSYRHLWYLSHSLKHKAHPHSKHSSFSQSAYVIIILMISLWLSYCPRSQGKYSEKSVCRQDVYLLVLLTRLTPVIKNWLLLKPTNFDMNRLATFHSYDDKENCFRIWETQERAVNLDSFLSLPTDCCCQLTVANWQPICRNIFNARPETYCHCCES